MSQKSAMHGPGVVARRARDDGIIVVRGARQRRLDPDDLPQHLHLMAPKKANKQEEELRTQIEARLIKRAEADDVETRRLEVERDLVETARREDVQESCKAHAEP